MPGLAFLGGTSVLLTLPSQSVGGDDFTKTYTGNAHDIVHTRFGAVIGLRPWTTTSRWKVRFNGVNEAMVNSLKQFFDLRVFKLMPLDVDFATHEVRWVETTFDAKYNSPDSYNITATWEEIQS